MFSIVKQALHGGTRPVRLFYANRDPDSVIFRDAIDELAAAHPDRLTVHHHLDSRLRDTCPPTTSRRSSPTPAATADPHVYICGPTPFMDLVEAGAARGRGPDRSTSPSNASSTRSSISRDDDQRPSRRATSG